MRVSRPRSEPLARDSRGRVLDSNFSTQRSAKTRALQDDHNAEALRPRRFTWEESPDENQVEG